MNMRQIVLTLGLLSLLLLSACQTAPKKDLVLEQIRNRLSELQSDQELSGYAPLALGEAERATRAAENATGNDTQRLHLLYMADRRIQIARAAAQREKMESELEQLRLEHSRLLVRASQLETEQARQEADQARMMSQAAAEDAERARMEADSAMTQEEQSAMNARQAREEANQAKALAESSALAASLAKKEANLASEQAQSLRRQLENLQLRQTESGVVVTLGDVLFETGQAELKSDAVSSLAEVVDLLQSEPEKKIRIEGHTDAVGEAGTNIQLSQQRADSVLNTLVDLGVDAARVTAAGMGEDFPIATNETADGRSKNRRVDVILLDD
ncbi:MAG: OmpA family protein [Xanthomonadales bacterium]|nr:OmpA family protein [Xanthomonadales bacterium]